MPATPTIVIKYVDSDTEHRFPATDWPLKRSEGVDWIKIGHEKFTIMGGQSVYWLYSEDDKWVLGGGGVGNNDLSPEILVGNDDVEHGVRQPESMPDLFISSIKLGWWWPGTKSRVDA